MTNSTSTITATYTRLRSGEWGIRIVGGQPQPGAVVAVGRRDGTVVHETIGRILWTGPGRDGETVTLATIPHRERRRSSGRGRRYAGGRYECEECGDIVEPGSRCWETGMVH
jgi:hypothetical protein